MARLVGTVEEKKRPHGGARPGAGRPKKEGKRRVPHTTRPKVNEEHAASITLRLRVAEFGGNLRDLPTLMVVLACIEAANDRFGMRICHYSVQTNHIHQLVEAEDSACLTRGMRGLNTRLARQLNKHFGRKGPIFEDRFHGKQIETNDHVGASIQYVGTNDANHDCVMTFLPFDPCSSAAAFKYWVEGDLTRYEIDERFAFALNPPVVPPRHWLLREGWFLSRYARTMSIRYVPRRPHQDPTQRTLSNRRLVLA